MNRFLKNGVARVFACVSVVVGLIFWAVGCGDSGGGPSGPQRDSRLVLGDSHVWATELPRELLGIADDEDPGLPPGVPIKVGFSFKANGSLTVYAGMLGVWIPLDEQMGGMPPFTWRTSEDMLYLINSENPKEPTAFTYSVSGNGNTLSLVPETMSIPLVLVFTKEPLSTGVQYDPALLNTAWVAGDPEGTDPVAVWAFAYGVEDLPVGMAIYAEGMFDSDEPEVQEMYIWSTSNGSLVLLSWDSGEEISYKYNVSGDELTLNGVTYTKYEDSGLFKSRAGKLSKAPKLSNLIKLFK